MKKTPLKRKTSLRKRGKSEMSKAKAKAWTAFSKWIRERDNYTCITCGKEGKGSFMHAGHYISRKHQATLFDPQNCHAQCMNCNVWGYGNTGVYTLKLKEKYGEGIIEELVFKSQQIKQFTTKELEEIAEQYKPPVQGE